MPDQPYPDTKPNLPPSATRHMPSRLIYPAIVILSSLLCTSCKDDPELVRKRDQQRVEIRRLEGELSLLQEQLEDAPMDRSDELEELRNRVTSENEKIAELEIEVVELESRKRQLEREYESYTQKYRVR